MWGPACVPRGAPHAKIPAWGGAGAKALSLSPSPRDDNHRPPSLGTLCPNVPSPHGIPSPLPKHADTLSPLVSQVGLGVPTGHHAAGAGWAQLEEEDRGHSAHLRLPRGPGHVSHRLGGGGERDTGDNPLMVPDPASHSGFAKPAAWNGASSNIGPRRGPPLGWHTRARAAGYRQGFAMLPALPATPQLRSWPVPHAGSSPAVPDGGPPAGRGVPGGARSTVRLLGWISGLITARLRARQSTSTLPATCPAWVPQMVWGCQKPTWGLILGTAQSQLLAAPRCYPA